MMRRVIGWSVAFAVLAALPAMAAFTANLGPAHSNLGGFGGGSFGVHLAGSVPSYLKFGPSAGENWGSGKSDIPWGRTFCVEGVVFNTNTNYNATVDGSILYGNNPPNTAQVLTLTPDTRRVFANYVLGNFGVIGPGDTDKNRAMQAYFWDQQQVRSDGVYAANMWFNSLTVAQKNYYTNTLAAASITGKEGLVRVLNLWQGTPYVGTDKQSHLVMIPAPAAALLGLIGLGLAGRVKRWMA